MKAVGPAPAREVEVMSKEDFYWGWALHEDHLYTNRINYALVAEAMLFGAMAQLRASGSGCSGPALAVVYGLGVFVTLIWLAMNHRQLRDTDKLIEQKLRECVPLWLDVAARRPKVRFGVRKLSGYVLPIGLLVAWCTLCFV